MNLKILKIKETVFISNVFCLYFVLDNVDQWLKNKPSAVALNLVQSSFNFMTLSNTP